MKAGTVNARTLVDVSSTSAKAFGTAILKVAPKTPSLS